MGLANSREEGYNVGHTTISTTQGTAFEPGIFFLSRVLGLFKKSLGVCMKTNILLKVSGIVVMLFLVTSHPGFSAQTEVEFKSRFVYTGTDPNGYGEAQFMGDELKRLSFYSKDYTGDNLVDTLSVDGEGIGPDGNTHRWVFNFSTRGINENIGPGLYTNARRFPFELENPGFSAGITGVSIGAELPIEYSEFNILDFAYDYSSGIPDFGTADTNVQRFAAEFKVVDTRFPEENLVGHVYWNYSPVVTPEPATMALFGIGGVALAAARRRKNKKAKGRL